MIRGMEGREEEEGRGEVGNGDLGEFFEGNSLFFNDIFAYINKFMYLCRLKWFAIRNTLQDNI